MSPSSTCEQLKHGNVQSAIEVNILTLFSPPATPTPSENSISAPPFLEFPPKMVSKCVPKSHNWNPVFSHTNQNPIHPRCFMNSLRYLYHENLGFLWISVESPYIFRGFRWVFFVHFRQLSYQWLNLKGGAISWCSLSSKLELKTFPEFLVVSTGWWFFTNPYYEKNICKSNWIMKPPSRGVFHMFFFWIHHLVTWSSILKSWLDTLIHTLRHEVVGRV